VFGLTYLDIFEPIAREGLAADREKQTTSVAMMKNIIDEMDSVICI
jgi:hypothetical protein